MPRGPRLDSPGTLHHVIIRGIEKREIVADDEDREIFVSRMGLVYNRRHDRLSLSIPVKVYRWLTPDFSIFSSSNIPGFYGDSLPQE
jgi:hypothetical protein